MKSADRFTGVLFYVSIISLVYFILIVFWSYYPPKSTGALRFFGELLTIPFLLLILFGFGYSLISVMKKRYVKISLLTLGINLVSILFLIGITYIEVI